MFGFCRRLAHLERKVREMDSRIQAIADTETALEAVIDAVIADHVALVDKLNAAIAANDWTGVSDVTTRLSAAADKLKTILPAPTA